MANGQAAVLANLRTDVGIEAPAITVIGIVGLLVILEAIDPAVVVHIDTKEKLGPIRVVPQKGLVVVRDEIGTEFIVVLVEVGDEIVVLIPARKDLLVRTGLVDTLSVRGPVLVVVVFDPLVETDG